MRETPLFLFLVLSLPAAAGAAPPRGGYPESGPAIGLRVSPLVAGSLSGSAGGLSASADLAVAFALSPYFDYHVAKYFSIGFGPQFGLNVAKPSGAGGDGSTEIDLNLRLKAGYPAHPNVHPYLRIEPGAAILLPPSGDSRTGFHLAFAGGAAFPVSRGLAPFFEIGYAMSFYSVRVTTQRPPSLLPWEVDVRGGYLTLNFGLEYAF